MTQRSFLSLVFALLSLAASAAENLFPDDGIAQFARQARWQFVALPAEKGMPAGLRAVSEKTLQPIWAVETSAPLAFGAKKGDLVALTVVARGVAATGEAEMRAKVQDKTYEGIFNEVVRGGATWTRQRVFGVAKRDYSAGTMRLHLYPGVKRQAIEVRDWRLENFGPLDPSKLPLLAQTAIRWPTPALALPDGPPPPGPIRLPTLSAAEKAQKRYVIIKLDDFGSGLNGQPVDPKASRAVEEMKRRGHPASIGIIGKSLEWGNVRFIDWIKSNARANGGLLDYWQHGWTHQMYIDWTDGKRYIAEYAVPDYSYQKVNFDKAQRVFREKTGLVLDGFCAPCGAITDDTRRLLREHPEITTWLYGDTERSEGKFAFRRTCNLECRVGVVETEPFVAQYKGQRTRDYIMLQGHPAMWSDESFESFKRILDCLEADGWIFTTHSGYQKAIK